MSNDIRKDYKFEPRRKTWILGGMILFLGLSWFVLTRDSVTRQGINYKVSEIRIPLYLKILNFTDRHFNYQWLAGRIIDGKSGGLQKARKILHWTADHMAEQPAELNVVDDHVWNIIVRGYGKEDQVADVFATLSNYAGLKAFVLRFYGPPGSSPEYIYLAAVHFDGAWHLCDVSRSIEFTVSGGRWATVDEIASGAGRSEPFSGNVSGEDIPDYSHYLTSLRTLDFDALQRKSRSNIQSPIERILFQLRS